MTSSKQRSTILEMIPFRKTLIGVSCLIFGGVFLYLKLLRESPPNHIETTPTQEEPAKLVGKFKAIDPAQNILSFQSVKSEKKEVFKRQLSSQMITDELDQLSTKLGRIKGTVQKENLLNDFMQELLSQSDREAVVFALQNWLNAGSDFETDLNFRPGPNGTLKSWNTGRIFVLDALSQLDLKTTAQYAWFILDAPHNSTESVFALKVIAQAEGNAVVKNQHWLKQLTGLYLQAQKEGNSNYALLYGLDVLVYTEKADFLSLLESLSQQNGNSGFGHGANLAATRIVQSNPGDSFDYLLNHPSLWEENRRFLAQLFSNANPNDPQQAEQVESFLKMANKDQETMTEFLATFPNFNRAFSLNLLTTSEVASMNDAARADQAALKMVNRWLRENKFPEYQTEMENLHSKLERYVDSAKRGGHPQ